MTQTTEIIMNPSLLQSILTLSENRIRFLREHGDGGWYRGSVSHFDAMFHELEEVRAEMDAGKRVYLEDELGDIFWVFICLLEWLEQEWKIEKQRIFERCYQKFSERIGNDGLWVADWDEVKKLQKERLKQEQESLKL